MTDPLEQLNPTSRFSNRVDNYAKYRPSYPEQIIPYLEQTLGLTKEWTIADIGSGTGIFSELLLKKGYHVLGVEPNDGMREEAEKKLAGYPAFTSIHGKAEETALAAQSIHLITIAQAFHWMSRDACKKEFQRILIPGGFIVLIWNVRLTPTPFLKAFEELKIKYGTDYKASRMVNEKEIAAFFEPKPLSKIYIGHAQVVDYESLKGHLLSSSYIPLEGEQEKHMMEELKDMFNTYNENGFVKIEYEAYVYVNA